jgi:hypothetical protein
VGKCSQICHHFSGWVRVFPTYNLCDNSLKGYNLWNPKTKKAVYSRDVIFREMKYVKHKVIPKE